MQQKAVSMSLRVSTNAMLKESGLQNRLLAALPEMDWKRLQRSMSLYETLAGRTLYEPGAQLDYAYFPTTSIISLQHVGTDGASTEIAAIGNEGMLGVTAFMGGSTTADRVVVQSAGAIYRLKSEVLKEEFGRGGAVQDLLLRYTRARLTQIAQIAVCNQRHSIDQQLCRWLLLTLDRLPTEELTMTHELLANTLGVRREGITEAAHKLQAAGLITYRRGRITLTDRAGLETCSCECYAVVRNAYMRLPGAREDAARAKPAARVSAPEPVAVCNYNTLHRNGQCPVV